MARSVNSQSHNRFRRLLTPSLASLGLGLGLGLVVVVGHVVYISLHSGTIWINYQGGYFAAYYTNYVVQPLLTVFQSDLANRAGSVLVWSIIGGGLYALGEYLVSLLRSWYKQETSLQVVNNHLVFHPQQTGLVIQALWRLIVGVIIAILWYLLLPVAHYALRLDYKIAVQNRAWATLQEFGLAVFIWFIIVNLAVILLRLYSGRVRLSGGSLN